MTVVFKLGGSLLTLPGLAERLRALVQIYHDRQSLFVTGGGPSADVIRDLSRIHGLSEESAHWLAIESLNLNCQFLQSILGWPCVSTRQAADAAWQSGPTPLLLDLPAILKAEEADLGDVRHQLPHDWDVTSDSIAAWLTLRWPADELILLKSIPVPHHSTAAEASGRDFVDPYFPKLAIGIPRIHWCNLRATPVVIEPWLSTQD